MDALVGGQVPDAHPPRRGEKEAAVKVEPLHGCAVTPQRLDALARLQVPHLSRQAYGPRLRFHALFETLAKQQCTCCRQRGEQGCRIQHF